MGNTHSDTEHKSRLVDAILDPENEKAMKAAFKSYDTKHLGCLNEEEFKSFVDDMMRILVASGLKREKLFAQMTLEELQNALFEEVDTNKNGLISYDEFKEAVVKQKINTRVRALSNPKMDTKTIIASSN
jgi:Ca2+-binding EF-hand superfamily protein